MTTTERSRGRALATVLTAPALALALIAGVPGAALSAVPADYSNVAISLTPFMTGLDGPVQVTNAADGSKRLFVVEQRGVIKVWRAGHGLSTFLDMRPRSSSAASRVSSRSPSTRATSTTASSTSCSPRRAPATSSSPSTRPARRTRTRPPRVLPATAPDRPPGQHEPQRRHDRVRPGRATSTSRSATAGAAATTRTTRQNLDTLFGKILRIDVNGTSGGLAYRIPTDNPYARARPAGPEIWSLGLRNPWRFSFDRRDRRPVDRRRRPGHMGGGRPLDPRRAGGRANYGWHVMEGNACYNPSSGCDMTGLQLPVAVYDHGMGCAIIGGYVYRGPQTLMQGAYLFSDVCSGTIWPIVAAGPTPQTPTRSPQVLGITSFGEGESGAVYVTAQDGNVYRLDAAPRWVDHPVHAKGPARALDYNPRRMDHASPSGAVGDPPTSSSTAALAAACATRRARCSRPCCAGAPPRAGRPVASSSATSTPTPPCSARFFPDDPGRRARRPAPRARHEPARIRRLLADVLDAMTPRAPDLTFLVALAAGLISFLSPCVLPLVPAYLGQLTAIAVAASAARARRRRAGRPSGTRSPTSPGSGPSSRSSASPPPIAGGAARRLPAASPVVGGALLIVIGLNLAGILTIPARADVAAARRRRATAVAGGDRRDGRSRTPARRGAERRRPDRRPPGQRRRAGWSRRSGSGRSSRSAGRRASASSSAAS